MNRWLVWLIALGLGAGLGRPAAAPTVYVSNAKDNSISVIDADTMAVTATVPVGVEHKGLGISPAEKRLFTTNGVSKDVYVMDVAKPRAIKSISVGRFPLGASSR